MQLLGSDQPLEVLAVSGDKAGDEWKECKRAEQHVHLSSLFKDADQLFDRISKEPTALRRLGARHIRQNGLYNRQRYKHGAERLSHNV